MINWVKDRNNCRKLYGFIGEIKIFTILGVEGKFDLSSSLPMVHITKVQNMHLDDIKLQANTAYLIWLKKAGLEPTSAK